MTRYLALGVALALAVLAGAALYRQYTKDDLARERISLLNHTIRTTDSVYRTDTLYFNRKLKVATALHDTVMLHLTDTVLVKQALAAQDTAIKACQSVVLTCEARVAQRDSLINVYKSLKPSRIGLGVGATCGYGVKGADCVVGLTANIKLF